MQSKKKYNNRSKYGIQLSSHLVQCPYDGSTKDIPFTRVHVKQNKELRYVKKILAFRTRNMKPLICLVTGNSQ